MNLTKFSVGAGLALALISGCGSSSTSEFTAPVSLPAPTTATTNSRVVTIPPAGGTVALPATDEITGTLTFAPGAATGTELTVGVSSTPPPNIPVGQSVSTVATTTGFYYVTLAVNRPTDLALLTSMTLTDKPNDVTVVPTTAEQYRVELNDGSGSFLQEIPGQVNRSQGVATFSAARSVQMAPGQTYVMQAKATEHPTVPVSFVNNSGISPAWFTILGQNPNPLGNGAPDPNFYRVTADGQLVAMNGKDRQPPLEPAGSGFNGYADYNIAFPATGNFTLPLVKAGRIFISMGEKMQIRLEDPQPFPSPSPGATTLPLAPILPTILLSQPNGWGLPSDPNYKTVWDWVEFDYSITPDSGLPGMGINKTEVDMFGFGIQINMTGPTVGNQTVGTLPNGRVEVMKALEADPKFKDLLVPGPGNGGASKVAYVRAISPRQGVRNKQNNAAGVATFDPTYYDKFINDVWTKYKTETLTMFTSAFGNYSATVNANDMLVFSLPGSPNILVRKFTTADAFEPTDLQQSGVFYEPTPGASPVICPPPPKVVPPPSSDPALFTPFACTEIVSALSAAFNRSTLLRENFITRQYAQHPATLANFYQTTDLQGRPQSINLYAQSIHAHALPTQAAPGLPTSPGGGAAYAFGFDDNSNQSSFISENRGPTSLTITVTNLTQP